VGVSGSDLKVYVKHARKKELDQIKSETGSEIIYLDNTRGQKTSGGQKS